ncbi:ATP-binding protein [Streptomyces sp. NPDC059788]|uniref:ATP-binding protein n=1 Tax=Streptomyces sp. NPDC059788 TaxID=3346948 RepID=UPI003648D85D
MANGWEHARDARRGLLERNAELDALETALERLCGPGGGPATVRRGGLLSFAASAGMGKTALLAEVRTRAAAHGCTVLSARGDEQEHGMAFHVVRQLVQPALAAYDEAASRTVLGSWYDIVAPALGLVADAGGSVPDPTGVRDGLDWLVTRLAVQQAPTVLILDDAHWADQESLGWLTAFAPRAEDLPMLVVVAYRPEELPRDAAPFRKLAERHASRPFSLTALTCEAVASIIRDAIGETAEDKFCTECWAVTDGNPFEAVELAAGLRERGLKGCRDDLAALRELASAVKGKGLVDRLDRLGGAAVRLAWAVAVLGTSATPEVTAGVAALGTESTADTVGRLREARILAPAGATDDILQFAHPLIATAVHRAIPTALRVGMHNMAAEAVVEAGLGPTVAARHLLEVPCQGDDWVVSRLRQAAREYARAGAPDAARRFLARALREPPSPEHRAAVLFELGAATFLAAPEVTVNYLREALEEPDVDPELREAITYRLAQALAHTDQVSEAAAVAAEEARRTSLPGTRLRMQAENFVWSAFRADEPDSAARSRRLARLADHLTGDGLAERYILGLRAWDCVVHGEPAVTALRYAEAALVGGLSWTEDNRGFEVPVAVAMTFMYCDQPGRAEELFTRGMAECERKGWRGAHLAFGHALLGYIRYRRGALTEAEALVREGLRIAERVGGAVPAQWYAIGILIEILLARGRLDDAQELADHFSYGDIVPNAVVYPDSRTVYSELLLARGLHRHAEHHLKAVGRRLDARGMRNPAWCPWQLHLARATALTDSPRAVQMAEEGVRRARRFGTATAVGEALHCAATVIGGGRALKLLAEAVRELEHSPAGYALAEALVDHGAALRRAGLPQDAAERLYRGLEGAVHCGADGLAERARDELSAAGLRPHQLHSTGTDALTAQERAAAERLAQGWPTGRIAEDMATPETVVTRLLSSVCRKMGTDYTGLPRLLRTAVPVVAPAEPPRG